VNKFSSEYGFVKITGTNIKNTETTTTNTVVVYNTLMNRKGINTTSNTMKN